MKQHITEKQLEELDESKYIELVEKEYGTSSCNKHAKFENCKRMFSIGKMIEILRNEVNGIEITQNGKLWNIRFRIGHIRAPGVWNCHELCDALWEAVKEVL